MKTDIKIVVSLNKYCIAYKDGNNNPLLPCEIGNHFPQKVLGLDLVLTYHIYFLVVHIFRVLQSCKGFGVKTLILLHNNVTSVVVALTMVCCTSCVEPYIYACMDKIKGEARNIYNWGNNSSQRTSMELWNERACTDV